MGFDTVCHQAPGALEIRLVLNERRLGLSELGPGPIDLLVAEAAHHLGELGRGEIAGRFGLGQQRDDPAAVELDDDITGDHPVTFFDGKSEDGLLTLGAELDPITLQGADGDGRTRVATTNRRGKGDEKQGDETFHLIGIIDAPNVSVR